jgi:hypothetical protein
MGGVDLIDRPLPGFDEFVTSRMMQRSGWNNVRQASVKARLVTAHTYRKHKQVTANCQLCANQAQAFTDGLVLYFAGYEKPDVPRGFK